MGMESDLLGVTPQPPPKASEHSQSVTVQLLRDLRKRGLGADNPIVQDFLMRRESGKEKYGTELETFNGRDSEVDAYQELSDAVIYYAQFRMERARCGDEDFTIETLYDQLIDALVTLRGCLTSRNPPEEPRIVI